MSTSKTVSAHALNALLKGQVTLALLDIRDAGSYNSAHIPGSSLLPRKDLEFDAFDIVPFFGTMIVVCDDDGRQAMLAACTLESMGYINVSTLEGGVNRWASLDLPTEWGTNVPSKDFGEKISVKHQIPEIDAPELKNLVDRRSNLLILDTRTPEEFSDFCIPGGLNVPNGELALHISDILQDLSKDTMVVINCAGRTRSIIGARTLQRMGIPNVYDLKNGTAGWTLAGLELESGAKTRNLGKVSKNGLDAAETFASQVASEDKVSFLDIPDLQQLMMRRDKEVIYLIDVRGREEYHQGHIPNFRWVPGGQAVQRSDDVVAVHNARIIFACDRKARSYLTAAWYRQMGFTNVYAVNGGTTAWSAHGLPLERGSKQRSPYGLEAKKEQTWLVSPEEIRTLDQSIIIHTGTSQEFSVGHLPGSYWIPRGWLELHIGTITEDKSASMIVTCSDGVGSILAGAALAKLGYQNCRTLDGGVFSWQKAGRPVETGLTNVVLPPNDLLPMGYTRNPADTINYLRWEQELGLKYKIC